MDYNEKLRLAKEALDSGSYDRETIEYIFPELKESEDEKIKHEIKVILANTDLSRFALDYTFADMINWLEKQGNKQQGKTALEAIHEEKIDNANKVELYNSVVGSEDERIRKAILDHLTIMWGNSQDDVCGVHVEDAIAWLERQGENSPVLSNSLNTGKKSWTEEDEIGSDATIEMLEYFINYAPEFRKPTIRRSIDWLKSLKQRMEE